jgi:hypothetical protein
MSLVARPAPAHPRDNGTGLLARHGGSLPAAEKEEVELAEWDRKQRGVNGAEERREQREQREQHEHERERERACLPELEPTLSSLSAADRAKGPLARAWIQHVSIKVPRAKMRDHLGKFS